MRRYILLSLLLCLKWTAWGQATYDYRYWFDSDDENQTTGTVATDNWHIDADLTGLTHTYHSIHFQVKDTAGVWSVPVTRHFVKLPDPKMKRGFFWFNDDVRKKTEIPVSAGEFQIDVSELENQLHHVHYIFLDDEENATSPLTAYFLKSADNRSEATYHYWTDNNSDNVKSGKCSGGVMMLDMSGEKNGFHVLHLQGGMDGDFSQPTTRMFIKVPQTEGVGSLSCLCYVDGELFKQESVPTSGGVVDWTLDVSLLSNGFHSIQVQVVTPSGAATSVHESFFFRTTMSGELGNMKLVYNVDGGEYKYQTGDFGTGVFHFDIDVSALKDGLHRLNYMLMSETGTSTKMSSSFFVKTPLGGPGVANYKYWINENEDDAVKVTLDERQELFKLIALLPVDPQPIRSKCFHFEIEEDGTPMMYAKNDFHIQFIDVKNYLLDATRQYIDYNVGQQIDDFTQLESGKRVYKVKPAENEVLWFKVDALRGDSLSLMADQACTIQIFSPTGKEVFSASGSESVRYDGCHAEEDGTFYIALHDVTGTKSPNIALDFQHIDKYAILRWDVSTVGNGGCSTITYQGNGFQDLYAIDFVNANGDTIKSECIDYISDATVAATMNFYGVTIGSYDVIFHFTEEEKVFDNMLYVEETKEVNLGISVKFPKTFLRGTSCSYDIVVRNYGNSTAYMVPIDMVLKVNSIDNISKIDFQGALESLSMPVLSDSIDQEEIDIVKEVVKSTNDLTQFIVYRDSVNNKDYAVSQVIMTIPPNSTKSFSVVIYSTSAVTLNAYMPETWFPLTDVNQQELTSRSLNGTANASFCCYKEKVTCSVQLIVDFIGEIVGGHVNCIGQLSSLTFKTASDIACSSGNYPLAKLESYAKSQGKSLVKDAIDAAVSCITGYYERILKSLKASREIARRLGHYEEAARYSQQISETQGLFRNALVVMYQGFKAYTSGHSCGTEFIQSKPNCPPVPPTGGSSNPVNSYDPNDIYGYRAESGSKAIKKGQRELYYTIEFENDTAFATASAQNVYLTDTLDARYFDLKSFTPTELRIGDKKVELNGNADFVTTVDMRPSINAIAQIECDYDGKTGIAKWHFSSLDPMTMEPVEMPMDGFLPVNNAEGDGIGQVSFNINLRDDYDDGTEINNRASIVFDYNDAIITPTWTNVIDTIAPVGEITDFSMPNDSTITLHLGGFDNYSGVWKYDIYAQLGENTTWFEVAEDVTDSLYNYIIYEDIDYGFCVVATDSAGNVESKILERQCTASVLKLGDANSDGTIDAADVVLTISKYLGNDVLINTMAADVNRDGVIDAQDIVGIQQIFLESETLSRVNVHKQRIRLWQKQ